MTSPEKVARILELAAAGMSDTAIGRTVGLSSRTVLRIRQRYHLPTNWRWPEPQHGTPIRYRKGCRCPECRQAHSARLAAGRADRLARMAAGTATFKHGASGYQNWGCRCDICTRANRARNRRTP